jgi:flagellar biosynthetic protein FliR
MVLMRISAMISVFPVFSTANFPRTARIGLAVLISYLVSSTLPSAIPAIATLMDLIRLILQEVAIGLILGFTSRMVFYAIDVVGGIIAMEIGLQMPGAMNPLTHNQSTELGSILYYLTAMLWLSLDFHHALIAGLSRSYAVLGIGSFRMGESVITDLIARTSQVFLFGLQMSAPVLAVSFIVLLVYSVLGRAVPQMSVFSESFAVRIIVGLLVFGTTCQFMAQHIVNYLRRLPEDMLNVARLLGAG